MIYCAANARMEQYLDAIYAIKCILTSNIHNIKWFAVGFCGFRFTIKQKSNYNNEPTAERSMNPIAFTANEFDYGP